ncbi:hypothetical protein R1flu_013863 [Riccia fluitans]|uniref:Reverse transcriptase domain-containing protein n=1 Tax=Riccia fluitans TaxID=41844 RepID=A0ABD1YEL3_9MARC
MIVPGGQQRKWKQYNQDREQATALPTKSMMAGRLSTPTAYLLGALCLLALEKPSGGVRPIAVGEVLYRLVASSMGFQFREAVADHFSPLQFGMATRGGYETIIHGLWATLDLHPDWDIFQVDIKNAFNTVSREALFRELRAATGSLDKLFPFVHSFYAHRLPLYFSHCSHEDEVNLFLSESGTPSGRSFGWLSVFFSTFTCS